MSDKVNSLVEQTASRLIKLYPSRLSSLSREELQKSLLEIFDDVIPKKINLSTSSPDYESVLYRLVKEIETSDSWNDTTVAATGSMLLRLIASDIAYSQFSYARAMQESHAHTARNESSIYANARSLGVRLERNIPATVVVRLQRIDTGFILTVPAMSQFVIRGINFFNRDTITFDENTVFLETSLYQGEVFSETITSSGAPYQVFEIGYENWMISDTDVSVVVNSLKFTRTTKPLFLYGRTDRVFYDSTLPNGNLELKFGNGIYGASPAVGAPVEITWVETNGASTEVAETGIDVEWQNSPSGIVVTGTTLSGISGGRNHLKAEYYKNFASDLRGSNEAAHKRSDHRALALKYPGVYDVRFRGQAELGPDKPSLANVVGVTLLTDPPFTESQWTKFTKHFESGAPFKPLLKRIDPEISEITIEAEIYIHVSADKSLVETELKAHVQNAFKPDYDTLGRSWYISDITTLLKGNKELSSKISHIKLLAPTTDVELTSAYKWIKLKEVKLKMYYSLRDEFKGRID